MIANSLSITIAQRTREFATIRTLGGSRRQVLGSIVVEALVVGTIASIIGLVSGLALAKGLFKLFDAVGFTLPNQGLLLETRTIVVSLLVGILVTLLASLRPRSGRPACRRSRPCAKGATLPESRFARFRTVGSLALTGLGFAALAYGLFGSDLGTTQILLWMGVGALLIFVGVALFSARLVRPLAKLLGAPAARIGGAAGKLARDNARRNPQRTASTAAALMIGLALVTLVATLAAGITSTFRGAVDEIFTSDYAITAQNNFSPIPTDAAEAVAKVPGVEAVASTRTGEARIFDKTEFVTAVDDEADKVLTLQWKEGSQRTLATLGADGAFVDDSYAEDHDLHVGSPVTVQVPSGKMLRLQVKGIFEPPAGGSPFGHVTFSSTTFDREYESPKNLYTFVQMRGDIDPQNTTRLEEALKDFPNAKAQTREEFVDNQISGLNDILNILYVLLALSVIVSLFGIVNTLVLTVFERTRELGMLRAIGMTRRPGAADDPARERDHRADRRRTRNHPGGRPRRLVDRQGRLHRVLAPDVADHRLRDRDDRGRHPRRDLPGASRGEARSAQSAAVRVASPRLRGIRDADDARGGELVDLRLLVTRLDEDLGGVLAEERRRAAVLDALAVERERQRGEPEVRDRRVGEALHDSERLGLR